ncbi:MAG: hypothetical protein LJE91_09370 [Gammaproteobacteria bacterium]|jgi:hypothetical protein|nr:hypothetical protein [Gammaproteobacteria bacterium]
MTKGINHRWIARISAPDDDQILMSETRPKLPERGIDPAPQQRHQSSRCVFHGVALVVQIVDLDHGGEEPDHGENLVPIVLDLLVKPCRFQLARDHQPVVGPLDQCLVRLMDGDGRGDAHRDEADHHQQQQDLVPEAHAG